MTGPLWEKFQSGAFACLLAPPPRASSGWGAEQNHSPTINQNKEKLCFARYHRGAVGASVENLADGA